MKGSRPMTDAEVRIVADVLGHRDRALFLLGVAAGFRISELLSLRVGDVEQHGRVVEAVSVARRNMKGSKAGRTVPLAPIAREAVASWLAVLRTDCPLLPKDGPLFASRKGGTISRVQAWRTLSRAYAVAGMTGKLGTHAMRKTFAGRVYDALGRDLVRTQAALGHRSVNSTVSYLSFAQSEVNAAILGVWG